MKIYTKDNKIKSANKIVIYKDDMQILNPTEEMILEDGWVEYVPNTEPATPMIKSYSEVINEIVAKQWNERTDISDEEGLDYITIVYKWEKFLDQVLPVGKLVVHNDRLWRVRQEHTALSIYPPSINTASLYEVVEKEHEGTMEDPIPYMPPMEIFEGKYYIQNDVVYRCTRDSGVSLSHDLSNLIGLYVELAQVM